MHVRRGGIGGIAKGWGSHYAVRVTNVVTGTRAIYWGGPGERWVAQFATDVAKGMYRDLPIPGALTISGAQVASARWGRASLARRIQVEPEP